ncbi:Tuberous sclerosis 2-like protein, partial [Dipsacomyces acuminosporus]
RHVSGSFNQQLRLVLSPEKRSEITALSYGLLTSAIHYKDFLKRDQENMLITAFYKGLIVNSSSSTTPQKCLHALSVSMLELPSAVVRSLPPILLQLIKISSSPQISVHLLEFVSAISRKQKLYATLRAEDYRMIFAVATNYIRFHNNQRRQMNASSASSKRLSIGASADGGGAAGNSSSSHSASTAPSLSDVALKQYILVMAYQVIDVYFLSLSPNLRAETVNNLLQGILQANFSRDSLDELNEVILDMILQNFNNASDDLLHQEVAVKEDLGSVIERTWIQHNSLVTIRAQRSGPLAQIIVRSPSAATSRVVDLPAEAARKYSERSELPAQSPPSGFASASESPATTPRTPTMLSGDSAAATPYSLSTSTSTTSTRRESIASTIPRGGSGYIAGRNHRLHPMAGPGSA